MRLEKNSLEKSHITGPFNSTSLKKFSLGKALIWPLKQTASLLKIALFSEFGAQGRALNSLPTLIKDDRIISFFPLHINLPRTWAMSCAPNINWIAWIWLSTSAWPVILNIARVRMKIKNVLYSSVFHLDFFQVSWFDSNTIKLIELNCIINKVIFYSFFLR